MPSAPYELVPVVNAWVGELVHDTYPDEAAVWGVSLQMLPDPAQEEAWVPVLAVYVELPVVEPNSFYAVLMLPPFQVDKEQIQAEVSQALVNLSERRAAYFEAEIKSKEQQ